MEWSGAAGVWSGRWRLLLGVVVLGAWGLRAAPLLDAGGAFGYPVDYDEGVYFAAASLPWRGVWPYRDFTFVHPPGVVLAWAPAALLGLLWDAGVGFAASRHLSVLLGAVNVLLVARLAGRSWGPAAGLVAALVYATYPELVIAERSPLLEPLLNVVALGVMNVWVGSARERPRWAWAGVLCGLAVAVKVIGGLWGAAALVAHPPRRSARALVGLVLVAAATVALVVGPFVALAPEGFVEQVLLFQLSRPPDGEQSAVARLWEMLHSRRAVGVVLALVGLGVAGWRTVAGRAQPVERMAAVGYVLTVVAFLNARSYWDQYNSHLAVGESLLAGLGAWAVVEWSRARPRVAQVVAAVLVVGTPVPAVREVLRTSRRRSHDLVALGRYLREQVPAEATVCAFEPAWALVGGRLPAVVPGAPVLVDVYGLMLKAAMEGGERFATVEAAFHTPAGQRAVEGVLERCEYLVVGWRGRWQLSGEGNQRLDSGYVRRFLGPHQQALDVWQRATPGAR